MGAGLAAAFAGAALVDAVLVCGFVLICGLLGVVWVLTESVFLPLDFLEKRRFRFARPLTAMSSRLGSILRQIAAAAAMTFTS